MQHAAIVAGLVAADTGLFLQYRNARAGKALARRYAVASPTMPPPMMTIRLEFISKHSV